MHCDPSIQMDGCQHIPETAGFMQNMMTRYLLPKLYMVHRLDKDTSGLVIFAKSSQAAGEFGRMFEQKKIKKAYIALVSAKPNKKEGWVKGDMKKSRNGSWMITRNQSNPAVTQFKTIAYPQDQHMLRFALLKPKTGKTHQLRVALKSLSAPILGDTRYKGDVADRLYLHAYSLGFTFHGAPYNFTCLPSSGEFFDTPSVENAIDPLLDWCNK